MKTFKLMLLAITQIVIANITNAQVSGSLAFDIADLTLDTIGIYTQPSFPGCQFTNIVSAPHMPVIIKQYLLPKNAEITSISISDSSHFTLPGSYLIYPTQIPIILDGRPAPPFVGPDSAYYSSSARYNGNVIEIESIKEFMGYHIARLKIFPLQYIASDSILILFNSMVFTINYEISGTDALIKKMTRHQYNGLYDYLTKSVENPNDTANFGSICEIVVDDYDGTRALNLFFLPGAEGDIIEYLIITNDLLKETFKELADWKTSKGVPALVVTTSQIEEYYPGFDLAEKIFNYLKDVRTEWNPEIYVLLGGDTEIIPARVASLECRDDKCWLRVSDLYFSDVYKSGDNEYNWNPDGDGDFWDEPDLLELVADNYLGRAPVKNIEEANNFIQKIFDYEKKEYNDDAGKNTLIGSCLISCEDLIGSMVEMETIYNALPIYSQLKTTRIYDHRDIYGADCDLNRENVILSLQGNLQSFGSQHVFAHVDHSGFANLGASQLCNNSSINIYDMDDLELGTDDIPKIMYSGGCQPNEFNKDCIAEHFINGKGINNKTGIGIGFIGNSGAGRDCDEQGITFFERIYNPEMALVNLGKIFNFTRDANPETQHQPRQRNLNLLGDPELPVWANNLEPLSIHPSTTSISTGVAESMEIIITPLLYGEKAVVTIYKDNEIYGVKETQADVYTHKVMFNCKPDTQGQILIKATAPNHLYSEETIDVDMNNPGVHLFVNDFDPSDLNLHKGTNKFKIVLENSGSLEADDVFATLSVPEEYNDFVQILNSSSGFPDIPHPEPPESTDYYNATSYLDYELNITNDAPDLLFVPFNLHITSNTGEYEFDEKFFLQIKTPFLTYRGNKITATSNNDIFVDPGDLVSFKVELLNSGCLSAKAISASITEDSDDFEIVVGFNKVYFRSINEHDTAWCHGIFIIQVTNELPPMGEDFDLNLSLNIDYDDITSSFPIRLNNKSAPGDLSFSSSDSYITLNWAKCGNGGYNIYRLNPDDLPPGEDIEDSTYYERLNFYINQFTSFNDVDVEPLKVYYYKLTSYSTDRLAQGPFTPAFKAWTTLAELEPWPLFIPENGVRSEGSPILYNALPSRFEPEDNPELEIFFPMDDGYDASATKSALYAFYANGEELYNIDQNITTYVGFENFEKAGMKATPLIGEMNSSNAGVGDIAFATTYGSPNSSEDVKKVLLFSAEDADTPPDDRPDKIWETQLDQAVKKALVGATLIEGEEIKIIAAEIYDGKKLDVRNSSDGYRYMPPNSCWPVALDSEPDFGIPVAADINLDDFKEIIVGVRNSNGIYVFNYNGQNYNQSNEPFFSIQDPTGLVGLDCIPVVANLDLSDDNPEIILLSAYDNHTAHIFALDYEGNEVKDWDFENSDHIISISTLDNGNYPALTAADLDGDGTIEIIIADAGKVYIWNAAGDLLNQYFPIEVPGLKCPAIAPLVANVDKDPENEIIIASSSDVDLIYAFNPDGSLVPGWPLVVEGLMATPAIGDINHDGLNEIVAVYGGYVNVWKTEGETGHDEWPLYRQNSFNNAAYAEPGCEYDPNNPLVYNDLTNEIDWDGYNVLSSDLIIPDGEILTVHGRVAMPDGSKIIIEQGGRLNVSGGVITSACGGLWKGIEVWGYCDKSQLDEQDPPGIIELSENAVIENARCAIATVKSVDGVNDYEFTGGIVWCKDSKFLNNIYAVRFYNYRNFHPNSPNYEIDNRSSIKSCIFETNGRLADQNQFPAAFISMDWIVGIKLYGNQFINSTGNMFSWSEKGKGIESNNSVYYVDHLCTSTPCGDDAKRSYFINLYYGIRAFGLGRENRAISVMHSDFNQNQKGMFISTMNNARLLFNDFIVAKTNSVEFFYGLYLEYSSGYSIEENLFEAKYQGFPGFPGNIGLYISNSGREPNEVYKNDFKNLEYGIVAYGQNRDEEGAGLCLKCNNFELCRNDIHVIPRKDEYGNWMKGRVEGIASSQGTNTAGSNTSPAGNTYTKLDDVPNAFNYFNHEFCNKIYYNHHQNNNTNLKIVPEPTSSPDWFELSEVSNTVFNSQEEACPSNLVGGSINISLEKNLISIENELIDTYSDSIQALKDGGDTYALNLNVYTSTPDESYQIRQQLLDESPYLSDTVMTSAIIKENVLPNAMIRDVLVANPQSAKSSEIIDKVNDRVDPMPEEMMNDILTGRYIKGALEVLENKFASHKTLKYKSLFELESYYKTDTLDFHGSLDSLTNLWLNETDPDILYKLVFQYLSNDDSVSYLSTLNSIPLLNELSPEQLQVFEDFSSLIEILWTLKQCNCELDSTIVEQLMLLVSRASNPGALARNTLVANGMFTYNEPIYLSDELKSSIVMPDKPFKGLQSEDRLQIFPNPAKEFIIVSYNLKALNGQSSILINSIDGKPCISLELNGEINQVVVSLSTFPAGTYVIQLENKGKIIGSSTFVIAK